MDIKERKLKLIQGLTKKKEDFCVEYVKNGFNATQAYMSAFSTTNDNTATKNSNKLLREANVIEYIQLIKEELLLNDDISKIDVIRILKEQVQDCINKNDKRNLFKALDMLCKIGGLYAPTDNILRITTDTEFNLVFPTISNLDNSIEEAKIVDKK